MLLLVAVQLTIGMCSFAQSVKISAPNQVVEGELFTVSYIIENGQPQSLPRPLNLPNCTYKYGPAPTTVQQSMSKGNGRQTSYSRIDYTYTFVAQKAGASQIPSFNVNVSGKNIKTPSRTISILPKGRQARQQEQQEQRGQAAAPAGPKSTVTSDDVFIEVQLSKSKLYQQEAVIATIKAYTLYPCQLVSTPVLPAYDGFLSEELPVNSQGQREHYRGDNYWSCELKKCLLFPQKSGALTINSGSFDLKVVTYHTVTNGYIGVNVPTDHYITTKTRQVTVNVTPLPEPQPAGFCGAVGHFNVNTSLEPQTLHTNEAATYTIKVSGTGNVKYINAPQLDLGSQAEVFTPESDSEAKFNGSTLQGTFTTTYTIMPQKVGELEIEPTPFVYFDPTEGKYITIQMSGYKRKVLQGTAAAVDNEIPTEMTDILHIKNLSNTGDDVDTDRAYGSWQYVLCYLLLICGSGTAIFTYRRRLRLQADVVGRRTARANKVATKHLRHAYADLKADRTDEFYNNLSTAIKGYLSDKLNIAASALTRDNITDQLIAYGASPELTDKTIDLLDKCEMARFTPDLMKSDMHQIYNDATNIINDIESTKKKNQ